MSYASEQSALKPSASQNPFSASTPWNLVVDAQTLFGTLRAINPDLPQPHRSVTKALPTSSTDELFGFHGQGMRADSEDDEGAGLRAVVRLR